MLVCGIDPGGTVGVVIYSTTERRVLLAEEHSEPGHVMDALAPFLTFGNSLTLAIEGVGLYRTDTTRPGGNVVGESVFATARQVGWFSAMFGLPPTGAHILGNSQVRNRLVGFLPAKDRKEPVVHQYLRDMHGGEDSIRGPLEAVTATFHKDGSPWRKATPGRAKGALWSVKGHCWSALAVAVAYALREKHLEEWHG